MRILLTGGSGFIGRNLAEQLAASYEVFAPSSAELNLLKELEVREYLRQHRFDVIVHSATTRTNRRLGTPADLVDHNCRMFFNLARNQPSFGKMIHFGSGAEYDRARMAPFVTEDDFDACVPLDAYGFSKYVIAKYIEGSERIVDLRLFGVFGPYEDYTVRFLSNACCRALKGMPIVIRQEVVFDYLYVKDLSELTRWFIEHDCRHRVYNACTGQRTVLTELARMVAEVSERGPQIFVRRSGMGGEYTADNSRLLAEMGQYEFYDLRRAIAELYAWYAEREIEISGDALRFDEEPVVEEGSAIT
jgi:UDP-glucose 4-epimerase